ncbi:hypothetical protein B0T17DRAFT_594069 [Bombardia bombarda]|uniref:Uncharacterized protein n=1 Tax=Bombardia bombarda TaxID=252184 RepID=A0AA39U266_9PEZI|nr:hypothetical protein B0T17DRAFT_594069 [Bombardia bombarda]
MLLPTIFVSILGYAALASAKGPGGRPCGLKIAPCPSGQTCKLLNAHTGVCVKPAPTLTTSTVAPTPTYAPCGGFRIPIACPNADQICMDDPRSGGCGMACDAPGICVTPVFCGGFAGIQCASNRLCVDDPRDDCDPSNGGADCGGLCV